MTPSRLARAFFSTSLVLLALAGAAPAGAADLPPLAALRIAEYETALAKGKGIYLILDPARKRLTVKSRGLELTEVAFDEIALLEFRPLWSGGPKPKLPTPTVWKITEGPGDADRETIAPPSLRPYSEEEEEEAPAAPAATTTPAVPAEKKPDEVERPSTYRVGLDNGWQLYITPESPSGGFFRRLGASVKDGWLRLKGKEPKHPPLVALVMPAEKAQSLHHLFRTGNEILVLP
jgi:hypothetical protein